MVRWNVVYLNTKSWQAAIGNKLNQLRRLIGSDQLLRIIRHAERSAQACLARCLLFAISNSP